MLPKIILYNDNSKRDLLGIRLIEEELKKKKLHYQDMQSRYVKIKFIYI